MAAGSIRRIVVGVDESAGAADALRWAVHEARLHGADVTAVLVWGFLDQHHTIVAEGFDPSYGDDDALNALQAFVAAAVGEEARRVKRRVVCDLPARALLDASAAADLLVVGARGLGGFRGLLLGSVSQHCLHHTTTPIAIIRAHHRADAGAPERVVIGVDGSDTSRVALRWALEEARVRGASLDVVHAWQMPYAGHYPHTTGVFDPAIYERASRRLLRDALVGEDLCGLGGPPTLRSVCGGAAEVLLDASADAALLALGSRGLGGLKRIVLGSVTAQVAHHATCPLVVVPPTP